MKQSKSGLTSNCSKDSKDGENYCEELVNYFHNYIEKAEKYFSYNDTLDIKLKKDENYTENEKFEDITDLQMLKIIIETHKHNSIKRSASSSY